MRPGPFSYTRPASVADALTALAAGAVPLAGGQSLLQAMRLRQSEPTAIVDISAITTLGAITLHDDRVHIGAGVTHRTLLEHAIIQADFAWLRQAAQALGDVQVRNLGTVVGNLCWADPRANMAVALLASDAVVIAMAPARPDTPERIPIDQFFAGFHQHTLNGRLATGIEICRDSAARGIYIEFSRQRQDLALCNVALVRYGDNTVRLAVGGIDPTPVRLPAVEAVIASGDLSALNAALDHSLLESRHAPIADHHGSSAYKLGLARTLIHRALNPHD
jgi:aerobic carbon-monoxide dehydrogenase medium subunit